MLLAAPTAALAAIAYEGRWAEDPAWCGRTRASGGDEIPIVITRRAIEQFASLCVVQSVQRKGATWTLQTLCRDEGQDEKEKPTPNIFVLRIDGAQLSCATTPASVISCDARVEIKSACARSKSRLLPVKAQYNF